MSVKTSCSISGSQQSDFEGMKVAVNDIALSPQGGVGIMLLFTSRETERGSTYNDVCATKLCTDVLFLLFTWAHNNEGSDK